MLALQITEAALLDWLAGLAWPFLRAGALLLAAPFFGARHVPVRVRAVLAVTIAWLVAAAVPAGVPAEPSVALFSPAGALAAVREVLIGAALGFLLQLFFSVFAIAGEIIALSTGLAFATVVDPDNGGSVPLLGQHYVVLVTLLFLAFDGHLALLGLLLQSFEALPAGVATGLAVDWYALVGWAGEMYRGAVLVALPAASALLLANVAMGLVARSAPQLNIFAVGFPVLILLGLVFILVSLPGLERQLMGLFESMLSRGGAVLAGRGSVTP